MVHGHVLMLWPWQSSLPDVPDKFPYHIPPNTAGQVVSAAGGCLRGVEARWIDRVSRHQRPHEGCDDFRWCEYGTTAVIARHERHLDRMACPPPYTHAVTTVVHRILVHGE